jgi:hypothetical protein
MKNELLKRLAQINDDRKAIVEHKTLTLNSILKQRNDYYLEQNKISEDLFEVDREIESLEHVISNSVSLAISLINPIKEKERIRNNVSRTIEYLEIENRIKNLLEKLKHESKVENKIHIILEANKLIKINHFVFDTHRELFLKESQDVLSYLHNGFDEIKSNLLASINKEGLQKGYLTSQLNELDRIGILTYKLTNDEIYMGDLFDTIGEYIIRLTVNTKLEGRENNLNNDSLQEINSIYSKFLIKISAVLNQRKVTYFKEFGDYTIFNLLLKRLIKNFEPVFEKLANLVLEHCEAITDLELVCEQVKHILDVFENFKIYIKTLNAKLNFQDFSFFNKIDSTIYDLGEKYCSKEIQFMKEKVFYLFREESRKNLQEKFNKNQNDEETTHTIEDVFYILKICGNRAIESRNLQFGLAIVNHIKNLINEDLINLLDNKISTLLVKTEKNTPLDIKYICREDPGLNTKFSFGNFFLISCINQIDQCKANINPLLDELKENLWDCIKSVSNSNKIELEIPNTPTFEYFSQSEHELINNNFSDIDFILSRYDEFLNKKLRAAFDYLTPIIKSTVDTLNSTNYFIEGKNLVTNELSEAFSVKFIEETEKYLKQWKSQLSEGGFNKFISVYCEHVTTFMENLLMMKRFSTFGVIVLEKDINRVVSYFQAKVTISVREKFNRLLSFVKILNFDTKEELMDHLQRYRDIKLTKTEIEQIRKLKK